VGRLLVELLPITILSALTPWTIVGVIVLLASKGGVKNAVAFSLGWITAILLLGGVIVFGVVEGADEHARSATWLQIGVQLGFAAALLLFAHVKWRQRPGAGAVVAEPSWIGKLDGMSALVAFVFGAIWINGFLVVPAALEISRADVTGGEKAAALVFYALGATAGQIALIAYRVAAPARAVARLDRLRTWLSQNSTAAIAIVLAVIGGGLLVKALVEIVRL
jgi:hypothetical protein